MSALAKERGIPVTLPEDCRWWLEHGVLLASEVAIDARRLATDMSLSRHTEQDARDIGYSAGVLMRNALRLVELGVDAVWVRGLTRVASRSLGHAHACRIDDDMRARAAS